MATQPRSAIIQPSDIVSLGARFAGPDGLPMDLDQFPAITIIQPSGGVAIGPTSTGVMRIGIGQYTFNYCVGLYPPVGTYRDVWQGLIGGFNVMGEYTFTVFTSQVPAINTDGNIHIGDDPGYNFSQNAICNINNIMKSLRRRLKSSGKARRT